MPIVFMLEKPTRKRLRCISRVACEGYVLYAQKPAQGGGYDCALEGAGPLNAAGMAQAFMAAGIGEMLHNALHAEMEAGKRAARKARGKEKDGGNAAAAAQKEEGNAAAAATTLSIRHSRFAALPLAKLVASLALHPPLSATGSGGLRASSERLSPPSLPSRGSLGDGTGMKTDEAPSSASQGSAPSPQGEGLETQDADEAPSSVSQGSAPSPPKGKACVRRRRIQGTPLRRLRPSQFGIVVLQR